MTVEFGTFIAGVRQRLCRQVLPNLDKEDSQPVIKRGWRNQDRFALESRTMLLPRVRFMVAFDTQLYSSSHNDTSKPPKPCESARAGPKHFERIVCCSAIDFWSIHSY